jgi:hypothetical protein
MRVAVGLLLALLVSACPLRGEDRLSSGANPAVAELAEFAGGNPAAARWQFQADYLVWWLRRDRVPPLLTTGPAASQGILGQPGTAVLYPGGDGKLASRHDRFVGGQFSLGYWLDSEQSWAVEVRGFFLERDSSNFTIKEAPPGMLLARPFIDATTGGQRSEILAGPAPGVGDLTGGFNAYSRIEVFGEEADVTAALLRGDDWRLDFLAGARFLQMRDRVDVTAASYLLPARTTLLADSDHFWTFDKFYGGELGVSGSYALGAWSVNLRASAALGGTNQQIKTKGDRTFQTPLVRIEQPFGLYVLPTNSGTFDRWSLDFVSEVELSIGYQLTSWLRATCGYSFLYWRNPVRAGDQIDAINPSQLAGPLVGPARPAIPFKEDFFWAQGVRAGMEMRW